MIKNSSYSYIYQTRVEGLYLKSLQAKALSVIGDASKLPTKDAIPKGFIWSNTLAVANEEDRVTVKNLLLTLFWMHPLLESKVFLFDNKIQEFEAVLDGFVKQVSSLVGMEGLPVTFITDTKSMTVHAFVLHEGVLYDHTLSSLLVLTAKPLSTDVAAKRLDYVEPEVDAGFQDATHVMIQVMERYHLAVEAKARFNTMNWRFPGSAVTKPVHETLQEIWSAFLIRLKDAIPIGARVDLRKVLAVLPNDNHPTHQMAFLTLQHIVNNDGVIAPTSYFNQTGATWIRTSIAPKKQVIQTLEEEKT